MKTLVNSSGPSEGPSRAQLVAVVGAALAVLRWVAAEFGVEIPPHVAESVGYLLLFVLAFYLRRAIGDGSDA